jgi:capsular exopolysaccharide synthesis family protein
VSLTEDLVEATREAGLTLGDGTTTLAQMGTQREQIQAQELKIGQLNAQLEGLDDRIARYQSRITGIPRQTVEREQLDRRLAQAERFYTDIAGQLQKTIIAEESELGYVKIMRTAVVPMLPVSPDIQQNLVLGLLLGLGLGIGGGFVRQSMNWQIYEPDDIQSQGYSLVGVIPKMDREIKKAFEGKSEVNVEDRTLSTTLFPLLNPWSPITENYRLVRANLRYAAQKDGAADEAGAQSMIITSPEPGDGKTTTATNLAITITLSGRKVLLIDADMRRPHVHQLLGVDRNPGLAEVLSGAAAAGEAIRDTVVDGLSLLTAGTPEIPPTELLDSERMRALLAASTHRFDVVIIDAPPVLAATDPIVLAPHCDAVLVVASADKTDFRALSQVKSTLGAVGVSIGGVIFNRYDAEKASGAYKYGYGYDYKYDYSPTVD